jgi:hypothetical protein
VNVRFARRDPNKQCPGLLRRFGDNLSAPTGLRPRARWQASVGHQLRSRFRSRDRGAFSEIRPREARSSPLASQRANSGRQPGRRGGPSPVRRGDQAMLDHPSIEFIGEIDEDRKNTFLRGGRARLFSIDWMEPFGLVTIAVMPVGTPVIGWRDAFAEGNHREGAHRPHRPHRGFGGHGGRRRRLGHHDRSIRCSALLRMPFHGRPEWPETRSRSML